MTDYSYLHPPSADDYLVLNVGADAYVPLQVKRARLTGTLYNPVTQGVLKGPMCANGQAPLSGQDSYWIDNKQFGLSATATGIAGVTDLFQVQQSWEILMAWAGISPRPSRLYLKQPIGQPTGSLDNNVIASQSFPDVGFWDGFDSPFGRPSKVSEFVTLANQSVNWSIENPAEWPVTPHFNFVIDRMFVAPVWNVEVVRRLLKRAIPARYVTLGTPGTDFTWPGQNYGNISPIPSYYAEAENLGELLADNGYSVPTDPSVDYYPQTIGGGGGSTS